MANYSVPFDNVTCNTSNDVRSLETDATVGNAGSSIAIYEIQAGGLAGSSNATALKLSRQGTLGVTPSAVTPDRLNNFSPAAGFTAASGWGTQPVLSGNGLVILAFNAFGGGASWVAPPGSEVIFTTTSAKVGASLRPTSGTGAISGHILIEQL